jgi:muconolactone delta-isomerase
MLFLVVSTPRPERPSDLAAQRQKFWPWIANYQANGICRHIYPRVGRGAIAVFEVDSNEVLHRILNEWADIIPAHFETYPLVDLEATKRMLAAQVATQVAAQVAAQSEAKR